MVYRQNKPGLRLRLHPGLLEQLPDKYADTTAIESMVALKRKPFDQLGSVPQIIKEFGGKPAYPGAIRELEQGLCQQAAH